MRRVAYLIVLIALVISSCNPYLTRVSPQDEITRSTTGTPDNSMQNEPLPMVTKNTNMSKPTVTRIPTATPTATSTEVPYPYKQVWVEYGTDAGGEHSIFDSTLGRQFPTFVIYTDNQFILYREGSPIKEKILSNDEVCAFLNKLKLLGLYQIKTKGGAQGDPIYLSKVEKQWFSDDADIGLLINGKPPIRLNVYRPFTQYTIQPVQNIIRYLSNYSPSDMRDYHPDRLVVFAQPGRILPPLEKLEVIPWPKNLPPLSERQNNRLILEGEAAEEVFAFFEEPSILASSPRPDIGKVFIEQGIEYSVYVRPLLPHEHEDNFPYSNDWQVKKEILSPFTCK